MRYLFSALFLFVISVIAFSFLQAQQTTAKPTVPTDDIPSVNFCELAKHPNDYNNKIIRVEANYVERRGSSYLYGDACNKDRYQIRVFECPTYNGGDGGCLDCTQQELDVCIKLHKEFMDVIGQYLRPNKDHSASRVKGVLVGRLIGPEHPHHLDISNYSFEIQKFDKGMAIPDDVPW